jgi:ketosteroid isomerase-like protein
MYHGSEFLGGVREQDMTLLLCVAILALSTQSLLAGPCPAPQARDGATLIQLEQAWAQALEVHDADAVGCILAEEFQDADPDGKLHTRAETLAQIPHRRPGKNILSELDPHVFGDFAYIRGLATLVDGQGKTKARVRFTDIYVYRGQRWLAVAGQESLLSEPAK